MKRLLLPVAAAAMFVGCGKQKPAMDTWTAAGTGNLGVIEQHVAADSDLNARESDGGSTPLIVAALFGQTEAARMLIENGAKLETKNNDGATALHVAAFFCHPETVALLLASGADVNARNIRGETPLDTVSGRWSPALEGVYVTIAGALQIPLDIERIKRVRPWMARLLRDSGG